MAEEKLLTIREVSLYLGISEKDVIELSENGTIPAYKIGGVYLRFKREQIQGYVKRSHPVLSKPKVSAINCANSNLLTREAPHK